MTTPLKRKTNRLNAKKSTGPRTSAGLRAVSKNATRHGMLANSIILPGESDDRFLQMSQNFRNELAPSNETELALVDMMTAARWRQMRIWNIERAIVAQEMVDQSAQIAPGEPEMDATARAALAFRSLADNSRSLDLINRYETANARLFFRSLHRLMSLRNDLPQQLNPPADQQPSTSPEAQTPDVEPAPKFENIETKPNVDFPEQNQQPELLKNDQESQPAQSDSCPDSSLLTPDSCLPTPDSPLATPDSAPPRNNWNGPHHAVRSN